MAINSRRKGKRGELEVAALWRENDFQARRGQQHRGAGDSPDVIVDDAPVTVEVKLRQKLNVEGALRKCCGEAAEVGGHQIPALFHRRDNEGWKVTLRHEDFFKLLRARESGGAAPRRRHYHRATQTCQRAVQDSALPELEKP